MYSRCIVTFIDIILCTHFKGTVIITSIIRRLLYVVCPQSETHCMLSTDNLHNPTHSMLPKDCWFIPSSLWLEDLPPCMNYIDAALVLVHTSITGHQLGSVVCGEVVQQSVHDHGTQNYTVTYQVHVLI